jgi:cytochrome c oxidase subunit IV
MSSHIAPKSLYYAIFLALMVLTGVTVGVTYVDLGEMNLVIAMGIAVTKAVLVVLFFMHVWWSDRLTQMTIITAFAFFGILVAFTLADYVGRGALGVAGR